MALVRTTVGTEAQARELADRLVDGRLAACVHVSRVQSSYVWKGRREDATEWLVEARVLAGRTAKAADAMRERHPYELPLVECVMVWVDGDYVRWAKALAKPG